MPPAVLPNLGGSLPNDCFTDLLGLPTIWVSHAHRGSGQHAANEHALPQILREGLQIMAGLFWDLGETSDRACPGASAAVRRERKRSLV
jgi:hypothetical protein